MTYITCRQCKKDFPKNIIIDGKKRCISNRKFCLECSPYGLFNRRSDKPGVDAIPRDKIPYAELPEKRKQQLRLAVCRLGSKRKSELIKIKGGHCKNCQYSKCERALSFHHRNPKEKKFGLTIPQISSKSWKVVLEEAEKCDLLCLNCHAEVENELVLSNPNSYRNNI